MVGIVKNSTKYSVSSDDKNNCHVRAISVITGISVDESAELHAEFGRKKNSPTYPSVCKGVVNKLGAKILDIDELMFSQSNTIQYPTLKQFIWDHPKGKFLLHRRGHAFALIDGVVHDWERGTGPRSRVVFAAEFNKE